MKNFDQKTNSLEMLKAQLKEGDIVYTFVKHVSRSGMSRVIAFYVIKESQILDISHIVAKILDCRYHRDLGGVKVSGCGMDMCFNTVYQVAYLLFNDGYNCK